jgi:hypothetical protein
VHLRIIFSFLVFAEWVADDFSGSSARDSVLVETPSDIFLDIRE